MYVFRTAEREDYKSVNITGKVEVFTHFFITDVGSKNLKESYEKIPIGVF